MRCRLGSPARRSSPPQAVDNRVDGRWASGTTLPGTPEPTKDAPRVTDQPTDAGTDLHAGEGAPAVAVAVATPELEEVWARALEGLSEDQLSPQHRAWVGLTRPLGLVEDTALLAAPNDFAKDVLESRLRPIIADALSTAYGREIRVAVTVQPPPAGTE